MVGQALCNNLQGVFVPVHQNGYQKLLVHTYQSHDPCRLLHDIKVSLVFTKLFKSHAPVCSGSPVLKGCEEDRKGQSWLSTRPLLTGGTTSYAPPPPSMGLPPCCFLPCASQNSNQMGAPAEDRHSRKKYSNHYYVAKPI